jgi:F-type H+-transporting ATPase subunit gamma
VSTLPALRSRIKSLGDLFEVVGAMRSLAAVRMQQATAALVGAREYAQVIGSGLAAASVIARDGAMPIGRRETAPSGPRGVMVFCAEHGFVGAFNEILLKNARRRLTENDQLLVIGRRGISLAKERGAQVHWSLPMTSYREGVAVTARRIAGELYKRFETGDLTRLETVHARFETGGRWEIERQTLLPLELDRFEISSQNVPPLHNLGIERLLEKLIEEYFFAELAHITLESLAAENAARLAAMSAAHDNIGRKLEDLTRAEHQLRQDAVTTELLDVVTGSEALLAGEDEKLDASGREKS